MCLDASVADHWDPTTGAGRVKYAGPSLVISGCPMRGTAVFSRWNIAVCCGERKPMSANLGRCRVLLEGLWSVQECAGVA